MPGEHKSRIVPAFYAVITKVEPKFHIYVKSFIKYKYRKLHRFYKELTSLAAYDEITSPKIHQIRKT